MSQWLSSMLRPGHSASPRMPAPAESSISDYINAVYYPNWRVYRQQPPSSLRLGFISHVFYAFAWPNADGTVSLSDEFADLEIEVDGVNGCIKALNQLRKQYDHIKIILSIGGGGQGSSQFPSVVRDDHTHQIFSQSVREVVDMHGFDGVDIDWEFPSDSQQGAAYAALLASLRAFLPAPNYILSAAFPAGEWALRNINARIVASYLDLVNLMAYDFSGPWTDQAGHQAQLRAPHNPCADFARLSGASAVAYLTMQGVPSDKILLGVPAYGRSFLGASRIGSSYSGAAGDEGTFDYRDLPRPGAKERVDGDCVAAYCVGGDGGFVTYDNVDTVRRKAHFAREMRLAGLFYWTGTGDSTGPRSLVEAGYRALHSL